MHHGENHRITSLIDFSFYLQLKSYSLPLFEFTSTPTPTSPPRQASAVTRPPPRQSPSATHHELARPPRLSPPIIPYCTPSRPLEKSPKPAPSRPYPLGSVGGSTNGNQSLNSLPQTSTLITPLPPKLVKSLRFFVTPAMSQFANAVYYPQWKIYDGIPPSALNIDQTSHILYAFVGCASLSTPHLCLTR